ncbi:EF-hand domain-containing protein [Rhodoplanes sp. TEM]|uniref:EF-hand domain-containing protein n=1 Tax=Rhodoplanes tepidamans TaxID=200616 RepID=A0ABT5JIA4_RHOTP|nr:MULTISPECIES: EF-hand domain-containing protein [Rhodoplanes]MDC7789262.1 EF-hand domain-containing protein [Rhodoplanes tepidamans]MDC7987041.1 EF-hand domain-containing protein [Rhodoplanes sp. TEM]MDQ0355547.1 hypothetical protein [Rhodoplanes tepidamans]
MTIGSISSSSTELLQSLYAKLDTDQSGGVTLEELTSVSEDLAGTSSSDAAALFESTDADGDGLLSETEVKSAFESLSTSMRSTLLAEQETSSDTAAADTITALAGSAGGAGSASGSEDSESSDAVSDSDSGGGGGGGAAATEEETGPFDVADTNQDGEVSAAEQAAYDAKHAPPEATAGGAPPPPPGAPPEEASGTAATSGSTTTASTLAAAA